MFYELTGNAPGTPGASHAHELFGEFYQVPFVLTRLLANYVCIAHEYTDVANLQSYTTFDMTSVAFLSKFLYDPRNQDLISLLQS